MSAWAQDIGADPGFIDRLAQSQVNGLYVYDVELARSVYVSPRYTDITGYTQGDLDALSTEAYFALFHPDDVGGVRAHIDALARATDDESVSTQYRFRHRDGEWIWLAGQDVPFRRDPDGRVRLLLGSFVDCSEQQAAMNDLERFTYFAAHDLREPVRRIEMLCRLVADDVMNGLPAEKVVPDLDRLRTEAHRMRVLVDDLRTLCFIGARHPGPPEPVALAPLVQAVVAERAVGLEAEVDPLPEVEGYPSLLRALYEALVDNVRDHAGDGVRIRFSAEQAGRRRVFGVYNDGSSVPEARIGRIFDPFRRFARTAGSGLGLTVCRRVVELHGGRIWAESGPSWTHVRFTLGER